MIEKTLRCTVCVWRGAWDDAEYATRVRPSDIPPPMQDIQEAYEEKQSASQTLGMPHEPPCPACGHHTVMVKRSPSFHPAM